MDTLKSQIAQLSFEDLNLLKTYIEEELLKRSVQHDQNRMIQEVNTNDYFCSPHKFNFPPGINRMKLTYYITVPDFDKKIIQEQDPWVSLLGFNYEPKVTDKWEYVDGSSPNRGSMNIYLYYKRQSCPTNGTTFECLHQGDIETWQVKDDRIYDTRTIGIHDKLISAVKDWDDLNVYIIDDSPEASHNTTNTVVPLPTFIPKLVPLNIVKPPKYNHSPQSSPGLISASSQQPSPAFLPDLVSPSAQSPKVLVATLPPAIIEEPTEPIELNKAPRYKPLREPITIQPTIQTSPKPVRQAIQAKPSPPKIILPVFTAKQPVPITKPPAFLTLSSIMNQP